MTPRFVAPACAILVAVVTLGALMHELPLRVDTIALLLTAGRLDGIAPQNAAAARSADDNDDSGGGGGVYDDDVGARGPPPLPLDPVAERFIACSFVLETVVRYNPAFAVRVVAGNGSIEVGLVGDVLLPDSARNLMIVAHADDETIFGGADLLAGPPESWVVVVANRCGRRRPALPAVAAFFKLAALFVLDHVDTSGLRYYETKAVDDIAALLAARRTWDTVVTHAPLGEYGHTQHRALHTVVMALLHRGVTHARQVRVFDARKPSADEVAALNMSARLAPAMAIYGAAITHAFGVMTRRTVPSISWVRPRGAAPDAAAAAAAARNLTGAVCWETPRPSPSARPSV